MVQLSLQELKTVLKVVKDKKRKRRRNKAKKNKRLDGYYVGGQKSDSSHMQGYSQSMPFNNTSNQQTEILALQKNLLENQIKNPDRFQRPEVPNNLLTIDQFRDFANPVLNRFMIVEGKTNQLLRDQKYPEADLIFTPQKPYYDIDDGIDVAANGGDETFKSQGNNNPYAEEINTEPNRFDFNNFVNQGLAKAREMSNVKMTPFSPIASPKFDINYDEEDAKPDFKIRSKNNDSKQSFVQKMFSGTKSKLLPSEDTPKNLSLLKEPQVENPPKMRTRPLPKEPIENVYETPQPETIMPTIIADDYMDDVVKLDQMALLRTPWYKENVNKLIEIEPSNSYPMEGGEPRFRKLLLDLGVPKKEIENYLSHTKPRQQSKLYKALYAYTLASNKRLTKQASKKK
jgi:hypothetical protein